MILDIVHDAEAALRDDPELVCANPLCDSRFQQTGLPMKPRRFCCDTCKQQASLIRRVAVLLDGLPDARVIEIVRGKP